MVIFGAITFVVMVIEVMVKNVMTIMLIYLMDVVISARLKQISLVQVRLEVFRFVSII